LVQNQKEVGEIERKTMALTLVALTVFAAIIGGLAATSFASAANSTGSETTTPDTVSTTSEASNAAADLNSNVTDFRFFGMGGMMMGDAGFGGGPRDHGPRLMGGMGNIEVSLEYTATVNAILNNDSDVQKLVTQGYNVTSIRPIIKSVIGADGTLTTKATTAIVTLQNGTSGFATASVDTSQAKVTRIVIVTRTVIDKTTS
jgi:hypothetical protein